MERGPAYRGGVGRALRRRRRAAARVVPRVPLNRCSHRRTIAPVHISSIPAEALHVLLTMRPTYRRRRQVLFPLRGSGADAGSGKPNAGRTRAAHFASTTPYGRTRAAHFASATPYGRTRAADCASAAP